MAIQAIRILLVDDHPVVRMGFRELLNSAPDIEVIAEAETGEEAIKTHRSIAPNILVMDVSMPGMGGMAAARYILEQTPTARIILLTMHDQQTFATRALKMGVKGYLTKRCSPDELIQAVRLVHRGRSYIEPAIAQELAIHHLNGTDDPIDILTPREFEVFAALADGQSVKEISETLFLSPKTVGVHRTNILHKLNINNLADITRLAIRCGVIDA